MDDREIRNAVRDRYASVAKGGGGCCGGGSCLESLAEDGAKQRSRQLGYSEEEVSGVPEGANMGLGCGTPVAFSELKDGETVMDLGSGGGFDCFIAAKAVGASGRVIGVDMTSQMIEKARDNAERGGYENVEFRLGEIEHLPAADGEVDAIISNCVINLVPNKRRAFAEAYRVLKPGGRITVSDMVLTREWPKGLQKTLTAITACIAGAVTKDEYLAAIEAAGFAEIAVNGETDATAMLGGEGYFQELASQFGLSPEDIDAAKGLVVSIEVSAAKPG